MAPELGWWPMSPWLSPGAASFILFNLLVGAIALMSSSSRGPEPAAQRKLLHHVQDQYNGTFQGQEAREASRVEHEPASVAQEETVAAAATTTSPQSAPFAAPAAQEVDRMVEHEPASVPQEETAVSATTTTKPQSAARAALDASAAASKAEVGDGESISLDEAYALARAGRQRQSAADTVPRKVKGRGAYGCGRGTEDVEGKAEVDARAEQFIRQFREELKLERINSILNYTHALRRTAGAR
ncbi:hypothetical protein ZWY2020_019674 [Hordeum vulgare]|nr:hypothetical protein ZWY2020_019674 [Hordeum vulgare]